MSSRHAGPAFILSSSHLSRNRPLSARTVVVWLSLYLTLAANWPLWLELVRIGGTPADYLPKLATMALLVFTATLAILSLTAWSRWMKPVWLAVVVLAAVVQHYMLSYRMVMDPSMVANVTQTDARETRDLLSWRLAIDVLLVLALPAWWLLRVRLARMNFFSQLWRNALLLACALALAAGGIFVSFRELAPLMRNHTQLRYMMNPAASLFSAGVVVTRPLFQGSGKLLSITAGAALGPSYAAQARPPLYVIVVGETARADHFSLNGYGRDTNPELAARQVLSWRNVHSCGTNTLASVPCMFSSLGRQGYEARKDESENLLDVLQAAGLAVLWLDNQAGCKDVCARVPNAAASIGLDPAVRTALCDGDECLDEAMLPGLDARIAALPAERRAKGVVLVLHQMGSHGPAYYKRSPPELKRFVPECTTTALAECPQDALINVYDNSILATDRFLARTIDWLKTRADSFDTGLVYMSDHGESLGEFGIFLHGLPYGIAPEVQKHVPMVAWFGDGLSERRKLSRSCIEGGLEAPLTHDNLYHTVLGVLDVLTPTYKGGLDAWAACRGGAG